MGVSQDTPLSLTLTPTLNPNPNPSPNPNPNLNPNTSKTDEHDSRMCVSSRRCTREVVRRSSASSPET